MAPSAFPAELQAAQKALRRVGASPKEGERALRLAGAGYAYHSFRHSVGVALRAEAGALWHGIPPAPLVLAGLFHDAAYRGEADDSLNVAAAVEAWGYGGEVGVLIRGTRFPYLKPPASLEEAILRDADLLEVVANPEMGKALFLETGVSASADPSFFLAHGTTAWGRLCALGVIPLPKTPSSCSSV